MIRESAAGYARGGLTTIVDGIMGPWMLPLLLPLTRLDGIRTHWIVLRADRNATLDRAQARTGPRDLVDEEPISAMWEQFADLGTWESHVIDTGPHSPAQTLEAVDGAVLEGTHLLT